MRKYVIVCAAFGALAWAALRSSPAHADPITDPATGITIDLGPDVRQQFQEPTVWYVVYVWDAQQGYVMYSWYAGMDCNIRAQNDCDRLNANGYSAYVGVLEEAGVDPSQPGG